MALGRGGVLKSEVPLYVSLTVRPAALDQPEYSLVLLSDFFRVLTWSPE